MLIIRHYLLKHPILSLWALTLLAIGLQDSHDEITDDPGIVQQPSEYNHTEIATQAIAALSYATGQAEIAQSQTHSEVSKVDETSQNTSTDEITVTTQTSTTPVSSPTQNKAQPEDVVKANIIEPQPNAVHQETNITQTVPQQVTPPSSNTQAVKTQQTHSTISDHTAQLQPDLHQTLVIDALAKVNLLRLAREAYWAKDMDASFKYYQQLVAKYKDVVEYKRELADVYWNHGQVKQAVALYTQVAELLKNRGELKEAQVINQWLAQYLLEKSLQKNNIYPIN
jgi:hypothetical protein